MYNFQKKNILTIISFGSSGDVSPVVVVLVVDDVVAVSGGPGMITPISFSTVLEIPGILTKGCCTLS